MCLTTRPGVTGSRQGESLQQADIQSLFKQPEGIHGLTVNGIRAFDRFGQIPGEWLDLCDAHAEQPILFQCGPCSERHPAAFRSHRHRRGSGCFSHRSKAILPHLRSGRVRWLQTAARCGDGVGHAAAGELDQIRSVLRHSSRRADLQEPYAAIIFFSRCSNTGRGSNA